MAAKKLTDHEREECPAFLTSSKKPRLDLAYYVAPLRTVPAAADVHDHNDCAPVATGKLIETLHVNGRDIEFYDFVGLFEPAVEQVQPKNRSQTTARKLQPGKTKSYSCTKQAPQAEKNTANSVEDQQKKTSQPVAAADHVDLVAVVQMGEKKRCQDQDPPAAVEAEEVEGEISDMQIGPAAAAEEPDVVFGGEISEWKIQKELSGSDINRSCRLLLKADHVRYINEYFSDAEIDKGIRVNVFDQDKGVMQSLCLGRWTSSGSTVLKDGWVAGFVRRRNLKPGDRVGLYWDQDKSCFNFTVLIKVV